MLIRSPQLRSLPVAVFVGLITWSAVQAPHSSAQSLRVTDGSISIRALADRQRRLEEVEFLGRLNPVSPLPQLAAPGQLQDNLPIDGSSSGQVQSLPPLRFDALPPAEPKFSPINTVLSVYGSEGKLVAEIAKQAGGVARYEVGDNWVGYRIVGISRDGVTVARGGKTRVVAVGGRL